MSVPKFRDSAFFLREPGLKYALDYSLFFSMHISESQQEFFRMLDEKIEKVRRKRN